MEAPELFKFGNGGLPLKDTGSLQRQERILNYQKRMIHYFFKKSHKEYKGGKIR